MTDEANLLRRLCMERYISTSAAVHRPLEEQDLRRQLQVYSHFLRGWAPAPDGGWLDLGCGQGVILHWARAYGYREVVGVDLSSEMLAAPRKEGFAVVQEDLLSFLRNSPAGRWQVVTAFDVIEHFSKEQGYEILREIRRVLRPDGVCLLQLPNAESPWGPGVMAGDLTHETAYSAYGIHQLAKLAGFAEFAARELDPPPGGLVRQLRRVLWRGVRAFYQFVNLVETGTLGGNIFTRVMLVRLRGS